ncbi:MAG: histone deacetylase family protein [Promethearchaeota archaeon]
MTTGFIYSPIYLQHKIGTHVESHLRLVEIMKFLDEMKLFDNPEFKLVEPRKATLDQIQYVHTDELIKEVREISELAEKTNRIQHLDKDTSVSGKTYEASLYSVGGNLEAIDKILSGELKNGFAAVRPPGHHSNANRCSGFCIFNNVAIAAEYLIREKGIKRIVIIDWDCHHGNGTQDIFYNGSPSVDGEVVMFNSHQDGRTLYPGSGFIGEIGAGRGEGKIINYPMPPRASDDVIPLYFNEIIAPICDVFKPEFILISAGFDTHWTDRLTGMGWTYQAPANYLRLIKTLADTHANGRIVITLEGGYEVDKQARAVYNCLKVLNDEVDLIEEEPRSSDNDLLDYINEKLIPAIKEKLNPFWNCF